MPANSRWDLIRGFKGLKYSGTVCGKERACNENRLVPCGYVVDSFRWTVLKYRNFTFLYDCKESVETFQKATKQSHIM